MGGTTKRGWGGGGAKGGNTIFDSNLVGGKILKETMDQWLATTFKRWVS